jgi:hypothetical protein
MLREILLGLVLLLAVVLVTYGVFLLSVPVGFIVGGVLLAALAVFTLGDI